MVASTTTGARAADTFPAFTPQGAGAPGVAYGTHTFAAGDDEDGDIFKLCKIPPNATVIGGFVQGADLDTNATETLDFDIGWAANGVEAADPDGFGNFGVVTGDAVAGIKPEVGIFMPLGGTLISAGPQTFSAETVVQVEVNAAAATLGGGVLTVVIFYVTP